MAGDTIQVELRAPETEPIQVDATEVIIPGEDGIFAVRPAHTPLLTTLAPGVLIIFNSQGGEAFYALSGGFAEIKDDHVTILANAFEEGEQIDSDRAKAAQERAETRINKPKDDTDLARAEMALARSLARIEAKERRLF